MKAEYLTPQGDSEHAEYIVGAESVVEQRLLTILRDKGLKESKDIVMLITGAEWSEKNVPGLPDKPVLRLRFRLEHRDGRPLIDNPRKPADPNKFIREASTTEKTEIGRGGGGGKTRVQHIPGQSTTVEIKD
jgi:hypothetical protein